MGACVRGGYGAGNARRDAAEDSVGDATDAVFRDESVDAAFRDESVDAVFRDQSAEAGARPFNWRTLGPSAWPELHRRLAAAAAQGSIGEPRVRQLSAGTLITLGSEIYQGSVLAPDGKIYGIPREAERVIALEAGSSGDPLVTLVGQILVGDPSSYDKWYGAALAWDESIYSSASDYRFALHVVPGPIASSAEIRAADLGTALDKWVGLRVAPNGKLYACPRDDHQVLEIDPSQPSALGLRRVGPDLGSAKHKWWGGVLAPNGKIYCIPLNDDKILEIDPDRLTAGGIRRVGPSLNTGSAKENDLKWWGGALASNGRIYSAPGHSAYTLEIRPLDIDHSGRVGPNFGASTDKKWCGVTLAPNGKLYAVPGSFPQVLEIDPTATGVVVRKVGETLPTATRGGYFAGTLAPNGKIYAFPWQRTTRILEIDSRAKARFDMDVLLNGHLNGY